MSRMSHDDAADLLGAYALDAIDADERAAVDEHLHDCPRCRAELREHIEVAGFLGDEGAAAPPGVWDRISADINDGAAGDAPLPPLDLDTIRATRAGARASERPVRARHIRLLAAAAAVVVVAAIGSLGAIIASQQSRLDEMSDDLAGADMLADPGSEVVQFVDAAGVAYAAVVMGQEGKAALVSTALAPLPTDRTYQLWAVGEDGPVSLGMLGSSPTVVPFRLAGDMPMTLAITEEPAAGSPAPTTDPMVTAELTSL